MRLCTSTNILFERPEGQRVPVEESIRRCVKAGYKYLDFCFVDQVFTPFPTPFTTSAWEPYMRNILEEAGELGVTFLQAHLPLHDFCDEKKDYAYELDLMQRALIACSWAKIPYAVAHPMTHVVDGKMVPDTLEKNVLYFRDLAKFAANLGVGLALENMWREAACGVKRFTSKKDDILALVKAIDRENVGICLDTVHGSAEGFDQAQAIREFGSYLKALHVSDEDGHGNFHILPYEGRCDWSGILQALHDIGYDHGFTYELQHYTWRAPECEIDALLRKSYELGVKMAGEQR